MITIVNYGMGNLGSLLNMFKRIGTSARIEDDPEHLRNAEKLVLPGVGAFDAAMQRINQVAGLREVLDNKALVECVPILGVCLGMQLLTCGSEEGSLPGLAWINGRAHRFPKREGLKVPHMGWNIAHSKTPSRLTSGVGAEPRYYFVHSYYVEVDDSAHSLMQSFHGIEFDSAIGSGNIFGVQFHPERSHRFGMHVLNNFTNL